MKHLQKQLPFVSIRICPSILPEHLTPNCNLHKSKSKKHHKHMHESYCSSRSDHSNRKLNKLQQQSRSISSSHQKDSHSKPQHKHKAKPYIMDRQVKEEYNLDYQPNKLPHKSCTDPLHECKYIDHYMCKIEVRLWEQKTKNQLLKRRNRQLTQQNKFFNEYFEVFEQRYRMMKQDYTHKSHRSKNKQKNDITYERKAYPEHSHKTNHHKSHHSKSHHSNSKNHHHHKHSQAQSQYEYLPHRSEYYQKDRDNKRHKMHSCVTRASSRHNSRDNFYFPLR